MAGKRAKRIAIVNGKGGVAKTTTVVQFADILSKCGYKILVIDTDAQGNATSHFGLQRDLYTKDIFDLEKLYCKVLAEDKDEQSVDDTYIYNTEYKNIDIIPSSTQYRRLYRAIYENEKNGTVKNPYRILHENLKQVDDLYDYIIMDTCPLTYLETTMAALMAADEYIMPVRVDKYSFDGLDDLTTTVREAVAALPTDDHYTGVFRGVVMADVNTKTQTNAAWDNYYKEALEDKYIPVPLRRSEAVMIANTMGETLDNMSSQGTNSKTYSDYISLLMYLGYIDAEHKKNLVKHYENPGTKRKKPSALAEMFKL